MAHHTQDATALQSSDWAALLESRDFTDRRVANLEAMSERRILDAIEQMTRGGLDGVDAGWIDFLKHQLQVVAFVAEATRRALWRAEELCTDLTVGRCLTVETMMYERQAQAIVLYAMDLGRQIGDVPIEDARATWETAAVWRPARELLTGLTEGEDWTEVLFAVNLCFEPLVGRMLRREFGEQAARAAGDVITPVVSEAGQVDWTWVRAWTVTLVQHMLGDREHGAANRAVLTDWVETYRTQAQDAAAAVAALADGQAWQPAVQQGLATVVDEQRTLLAACGL